MNKLHLLKITLLIIILAEEIKRVIERRKLTYGHFTLDAQEISQKIDEILKK